MTRLSQSNELGSYPDREEFQVERVIVWVKIPSRGSRAAWLERADQIFEDVWQAIPAAVAAAQQESRARIPEFWRAHEEAGTVGEPMSVLGIWIDPTTGSADYEVGRNHDRVHEGPTHLPDLPDGYSIVVSRAPNGGLLVRG
jgi:hypothetical protein